MRQLIILFLLCILFYGVGYNHCAKKYDFHIHPEIIKESDKDNGITDSEFETICSRIIETFKSDEQFVEYFQKDKEEFLKYRLIQIDTILPQGNSLPNYSVYANSYKQELTKRKVKNYKRALEAYCLYNSVEPDDICSDESLEKIFQ